jgi:hypothetical protein
MERNFGEGEAVKNLTIVLFAAAVCGTALGDAALGDAPRLLLVPIQTSIKPNGSVECDLYLYNEGKKTTMVPSFEAISKVYVLRDPSGRRLPRGDSSSLVVTHSAGEHGLKPGKVEQTKITIDIAAEPGDVAEVFVEIGKGPTLRSNSVLLICPMEEKAAEPVSSPVPTVTP